LNLMHRILELSSGEPGYASTRDTRLCSNVWASTTGQIIPELQVATTAGIGYDLRTNP
jgi:hypothetical protein